MVKTFLVSLAFKVKQLSASEVDSDYIQYGYNVQARILSPFFWAFCFFTVIKIIARTIALTISLFVKSYFLDVKKYGGRFCVSDNLLITVLPKNKKLSFRNIEKSNGVEKNK